MHETIGKVRNFVEAARAKKWRKNGAPAIAEAQAVETTTPETAVAVRRPT
jgi:hypothetical protein